VSTGLRQTDREESWINSCNSCYVNVDENNASLMEAILGILYVDEDIGSTGVGMMK